MPKSFKKLIPLTIILMMAACSSTPQVKELSAPKITASSRYSTDKITHFMLPQDGRTLVMIGNKNHYTFPVNEDVGAILNWSSKQKLRVSLFHAFSTDGENISLNYKLVIPEAEATPVEISFLREHHFKHNADFKSYVLDGSLSGKYYQANDVDLSNFDKFKKEYFLMYERKDLIEPRYRSSAGSTGNTLLFFGAILVAPLAVIFN